jgi:co-chaperonin GroES (HSP10)
MSTLTTYKIKKLRPIHDHVLVVDMEFKERLTSGGIILPSDDSKTQGIRPRWAKVYAIGPEQKDVEVGQYILIAHGRWTRGVTIEVDGEELEIRRVDNNDILLVSDEPQSDDTFSDAIHADHKQKILEGSLHNVGTQNEIII